MILYILFIIISVIAVFFKKNMLLYCLLFFYSLSSLEANSADLVIYNGNIYTLNELKPQATAVAVKAGKIVFVGNYGGVEPYISENTKVFDLNGLTMLPGFIESHGHIMGLGASLTWLDLRKIEKFEDLVQKVYKATENKKPGEWIIGYGWHQSNLDEESEVFVRGFPTHHKISKVSPENPVYLTHASGHAGIANSYAMKMAGISSFSKFDFEVFDNFLEKNDGEIILSNNGYPTGIFSESAQSLITKYFPQENNNSRDQNLEKAIQECLKNGVTTFHDAGAGKLDIDTYFRFINSGKMKIRLYVMLSGREKKLLNEWFEKGPAIGLGNNYLTIRSIKLNADGALGSRGAWLLEEYNDRLGHYGMSTQSMEYIYEVSQKGIINGFQICTHAIGDRANREVLNQYEKVLNGFPYDINDYRFRIEHAQHLHPNDISRFYNLGIIASIQGIHLSSDRPWAIDRLGEKRINEGSYAWNSLLKSGAVIINGTDTPVESINPIASFYSSVTRKTLNGLPSKGYEPWEKITRFQALKSYTLSPAFAAFEEDLKGSIEIGKVADFVILSDDIMTISEDKILSTKVLYTIINGIILYDYNKI